MSDISARHNITISGNGTRPLLLAHGFGCDQSMWRFITPAFEDDYKIVLFDYVGSGKSDLSAFDPGRYSKLEGHAADIDQIIEHLDLEDIVFVGHSVSSIIGILSAINNPARFSHLVLLAPSPCYLNHPTDYTGGFERQDIEELLDLMAKNYVAWAGFLAPVVMQNPDNPALTAELEESFCSTDPTAARTFAEATFLSDYRDKLPLVTVPSLIAQCSQDAIAPESVGNFMHRQLPDSTFHQMRATGHCPHVSHPSETIELINAYLAGSL